MVALITKREVRMLHLRVVLNLLIQCSYSTTTGYLTSLVAEIYTYADFEARMITKYVSKSAK